MPKQNLQFQKLFPKADLPGIVEPFMHKGEWALHQVLPILLSAYGPSSICISSFNVSEESLRALFFSPDITELTMLLDTTVRRHKLDLLLFAANITPNIRLDSCHAKIFLAESATRKFGIVGSANLNLNHRWESGFYFTEGPIFDFFHTKFHEAYADALPYNIV